MRFLGIFNRETLKQEMNEGSGELQRFNCLLGGFSVKAFKRWNRKPFLNDLSVAFLHSDPWMRMQMLKQIGMIVAFNKVVITVKRGVSHNSRLIWIFNSFEFKLYTIKNQYKTFKKTVKFELFFNFFYLLSLSVWVSLSLNFWKLAKISLFFAIYDLDVQAIKNSN